MSGTADELSKITTLPSIAPGLKLLQGDDQQYWQKSLSQWSLHISSSSKEHRHKAESVNFSDFSSFPCHPDKPGTPASKEFGQHHYLPSELQRSFRST